LGGPNLLKLVSMGREMFQMAFLKLIKFGRMTDGQWFSFKVNAF